MDGGRTTQSQEDHHHQRSTERTVSPTAGNKRKTEWSQRRSQRRNRSKQNNATQAGEPQDIGGREPGEARVPAPAINSIDPKTRNKRKEMEGTTEQEEEDLMEDGVTSPARKK